MPATLTEVGLASRLVSAAIQPARFFRNISASIRIVSGRPYSLRSQGRIMMSFVTMTPNLYPGRISRVGWTRLLRRPDS